METELREERSFIRSAYLRQLGPVGLSVLLVQLSSILNNLIVGRLVGGDGLAVMSAVNPVYFTCSTLGALLATGGSTLAARRIGEGRGQQVDRVFTLSVSALTLAGAALTALGLCLREPLLSLLGVPSELKPLARDYLAAYLPGAVGVMGVYVPFNYLKLVGKQNQSVLLFLVMAVVNAALDWLLAGVMGMGMAGVGLATVAGALTAFGFGLALLCGRNGAFHLRSPFGALDEFRQIVRFGSPSAVNNLCNTLFSLSMNHILSATLGGAGLAAFSLVLTLRSFSMTINNGVSMAMAPFAAVFSSERDSESLRQLLKSAFAAGVPLMLAFAGLVALLPGPICALFGVTEAARLAVAVPAIRLFALSLPIAVVNYTFIAFYASLGKTLLSNLMTVLRALALTAPLALLLGRLAGGAALWNAFWLAEAGALLSGLAAALLYSRKREHLSRLTLIDTRFEDDGRYVAFSAEATDEAASRVSEKISAFCEQNDLPPKTTMAISLALEEMLVILNRHALESGADGRGDAQGSTVRLLIYRADTIILRIRCFGKPFDPIKAAKADEDEEYLGVRMIERLAQTVVYTHTFGINNLTITI